MPGLGFSLDTNIILAFAQAQQAPSNAVEEDDESPQVPLLCTAADMSTMDMNTDRTMREFAAKLEILMSKCNKSDFDGESHAQISSLKDLARELGSQEYQKKVDELCSRMEDAVGDLSLSSKTTDAGAWVLHTGKKPLSMYDAEMWQKAFPLLFPYGDGVFGLPRRRHMTFQQWASYMLTRTELSYTCDESAGASSSTQADSHHVACSCVQCTQRHRPFLPPSQPRWSSDHAFLCAVWDSWRRMEIVRRATPHVRRRGWQASLKVICDASATKIWECMKSVSDKSGVGDVIRNKTVAPELRQALQEMLYFTSEVIGTDGARQKLRHEQMGDMLRFGAVGGFLTPNVADTRRPLMVVLHAGVLNGTTGGLRDDGTTEQYNVDLLDESPSMPSATEMLKIVARNPVAQARFFIICMRLFCEHILGTGPVDDCLRHHGAIDGVRHADGFAASGAPCAFGFIASMHGPIEEQARLSMHPHINFHFVNRQSQAWLRSVLRQETEEARRHLARWQSAVLEAVASVQSTCVGMLPRHFVSSAAACPEFKGTPYLQRWRCEDRFDGALEGDAKYPKKKRPDIPSVPPFVDHHIAKAMAAQTSHQPCKVKHFQLALTGSAMASNPLYRIMPAAPPHEICSPPQLAESHAIAEAVAYAKNFCEDHWQLSALNGHIHIHHDTCFKYVEDGLRRKPQHCRFNFVHFVHLWVKKKESDEDPTLKTIARVGKDPVLPQHHGRAKTSTTKEPLITAVKWFSDIPGFGAHVETDDRQARRGRINTVQLNPREGSTSVAAVPGLRGNLNYQDCRRTLPSTFDNGQSVDILRDKIEDVSTYRRDQDDFRILRISPHTAVKVVLSILSPQTLDENTCILLARSVLPFFDPMEVCAIGATTSQMCVSILTRRGCADLPRFGDRVLTPVSKWLRHSVVEGVVEGIRSGIQTSFYTVDYNTKPHMTCEPLLKHLADGMQRLEAELLKEKQEQQDEDIRNASCGEEATQQKPNSSVQGDAQNKLITKTSRQNEARRRLIRLWTSANRAMIVGCALQALQLLTRRETLRSHKHWRIMMKRPLWCAHEAIRVIDTGVRTSPEQQSLSITNVQHTVQPDTEGASQVTFFNDSFYDDWLHRGSNDPLASMTLYVYAMYVDIRAANDTYENDMELATFSFDSHYVKASSHVQVLLQSPRTPYLHGITVPSRSKDRITNALAHQILFRPTMCLDASYHREQWRVAEAYATCCNITCKSSCSHSVGHTVPNHKGKKTSAEQACVHAWRAHEAYLTTQAARADHKLSRGRRVPTITDLSCLRTWYPTDARKKCMVQRSLVPWLSGLGPHKYRKTTTSGRKRIRRKAPPSIGLLPALPYHPISIVLAFVGHVKDDNGDDLAIIVDAETEAHTLETLSQHVADVRQWVKTSPGFHSEQVHAEEFVAHLSKESSANLDMMTEARGRPRPANLFQNAESDDEKDTGLPAERVAVDNNDADWGFADEEEQVRAPRAQPGIKYAPYRRIDSDDLFHTVHRMNEHRSLDGRAGDKKKRIDAFIQNHLHSYDNIRKPALCSVLQRPAAQRDLSPSQVHEILSRLRGKEKLPQHQEEEEAPGHEGNLFDGSDMQDIGLESTLFARALRPQEMLVSPALLTRKLMAERLPAATSKAGQFAIPGDQYHACILAIQPLQLLWEWAGLEGKRALFLSTDGGAELLAQAPGHLSQRAFFHGAGGSGKTFCMNRIVLPVYKHYLPGAVRTCASQNSAARLISGSTFHSMAGLSICRAARVLPSSQSPKLTSQVVAFSSPAVE